ncbi:50S ribosome-binding GTPase, partial [Hellea sp.]|nr:50S ribosome-binding GTPase [Hellea sp.]
DLPGLIEGASEGAGLGHRFLGHVERCAAVLHLVDASADDPIGNYKTIRKELIDYDGGIEDKPEIVVLTKCDALDSETIELVKTELEAACDVTPFLISSVANQGLKPVLFQVFQHVKARREAEEAALEAKHRKAAITRGEIEETSGWRP